MKKTYKILIQIVLAVGLIIGGIVGCQLLKASRPAISRLDRAPTYPMARLIRVKAEDIAVPIEGYGTVSPIKQIRLVPQVAGKIVSVSPNLVDGGSFGKGEVLAVVDPSDYEIAVTLAKARVQDADSRYILQKQEAEVARSDWKDLHPHKPVPPLVAKEPQLKTAEANLEAVRAELERARLNLSRTRLRAPFNGRVTEKSADVGQYVTPGQSLAVLYSTEAAEIVIPLESKHLFWLDIPGFTSAGKEGSDVEVSAEVGGKNLTWKGRVTRAEGVVNEKTRMINVVVKVQNPYENYPPLAMGVFAKAIIRGKPITQGIVVPRSAIRQGNMVWVVDDDGRLTFRNVDIALRMYDGAVVQGGLFDGEKVVISTIKDVTNGMKVREILTNEGGNAS